MYVYETFSKASVDKSQFLQVPIVLDPDNVISMPPSTLWMQNAMNNTINAQHIQQALAENYAVGHDMQKAYAELVPLMADSRGEKLILAAANRFVAIDKKGGSSTPEARAKAARNLALLFIAYMGHQFLFGDGTYDNLVENEIRSLLEYSERLHPEAQDTARLLKILDDLLH
jgi:hypothetical protein